MNIIQVSNLMKSFYDIKALDHISFNIKKGSFTALLGKNGSGKSTILNILMGIEEIDSGECLIFGKSIKEDPFELKNSIGHVSEKIRFDYPLVIEDFILRYAKFFDSFDLDWFHAVAKEIDIPLNKQFGGYSRGQKMQIVLLSALAHKPSLLLIDEVTSVLDASSRLFFMRLLKKYTLDGGTVVITTNIVNEVQSYCTDVIFLDNQKIKFQEEISKIPSTFKKIRLTTQDHPILAVSGIKWIGNNSDGSQSYIVPEHVLLNHSDYLEDKRAATLEDLYIYHSGKIDQ